MGDLLHIKRPEVRHILEFNFTSFGIFQDKESEFFYYIILSDLVLTWISENFAFIVYANQKLFRKNLWGRLEPPPPLVSEGLIYDLSDH